ncbi:hypothetical protein T492DRAFT_337327 [Pavlovales sp. CCMP2436]|nr:hypothetical protein T492DRAFT_337327 [Pavlovales sp. CCMP2436]
MHADEQKGDGPEPAVSPDPVTRCHGTGPACTARPSPAGEVRQDAARAKKSATLFFVFCRHWPRRTSRRSCPRRPLSCPRPRRPPRPRPLRPRPWSPPSRPRSRP